MRRVVLFALLLTVCVGNHTAVRADTPPLSESRAARLEQQLQQALADSESRVQAAPNSVDAHSSRGDAYFNLGKFAESLADYERMVQLDPDLNAGHWRRGIARFYAGKFEGAAKQFEIYHTYDDVDRENGIWRFLSQTKAYGLERAREGLLKYKKDDREPFPAIYEMFAGRLEPAQVLQSIQEAKLDATTREQRLFYAQLYVGLYYDVLGKRDLARQHLRHATANRWASTASYGPRFMWHVGRVHYELLRSEAQRGDQ